MKNTTYPLIPYFGSFLHNGFLFVRERKSKSYSPKAKVSGKHFTFFLNQNVLCVAFALQLEYCFSLFAKLKNPPTYLA